MSFKSFLTSQEASPPQGLTEKILKKVKHDLIVTPSRVLLKLIPIHVIVGGVTLTICPQFGLGPWGGGDGVTAYVLQYGHLVCGAFCGAIFLGLSAIVANLYLRKEELKVLNKNQLWIFSILVAGSLLILMGTGQVLDATSAHLSLGFVVFWIMAAILTPIIITKAGFFIRFLPHRP